MKNVYFYTVQMFMALIVFKAKALNAMPAIAKNIGWLIMIAGSWVSPWQSGHLENIKLYSSYDQYAWIFSYAILPNQKNAIEF